MLWENKFITVYTILRFQRNQNTIYCSVWRRNTSIVTIKNIIECPTMKNKFLCDTSYKHKQKCKIYVINSRVHENLSDMTGKILVHFVTDWHKECSFHLGNTLSCVLESWEHSPVPSRNWITSSTIK